MHGAILAGGGSTRFGGRPKGLEQVGGTRLLDLVARALQAVTGSTPTIVANAPDAGAWLPGAPVVPDAVSGCGSLGGIFTAVRHSRGAVLVLGWDMPFVTAPLLRTMLAAWEQGAYDVVVPESTGPLGLEPLCAVYGPACAPHIRASIERGDYRTTAFHPHVRVGTIPLARVQALDDPARLFFNVNTPEDLATAEAYCRAAPGGR